MLLVSLCLRYCAQVGVDHKDRDGCAEVYAKLRGAVEDISSSAS